MLAVISYPPIPLVELGPIRLSLHGVFAAIGFLVGAWIAIRKYGQRGFDTTRYQSVLTWALVGSLVGARWLTIPAFWVENGFDLGELVNLGGNYSILGGFAGGIGVGIWRVRKTGLKFGPALDTAAFGLALGTVVGRIGDIAIVEHLGASTSFFLGYGIKPGYDVAPQHNPLECTTAVGEYCGVYHHSALYDMLGALLLFGFILWIYRWKRHRLHYGQLFAVWLTWYGFQRFLIDFTRLGLEENADSTLGPLTWSQWSALVAGIGGVVLLLWLRKRTPLVSFENDREQGATVASDLAMPDPPPSQDPI